MRHVITRDAFPYCALLLEISGFSEGPIRERRSPAPLDARVNANIAPCVYTEPRTRSHVHHGDSKDFSPKNIIIIPNPIQLVGKISVSQCRMRLPEPNHALRGHDRIHFAEKVDFIIVILKPTARL